MVAGDLAQQRFLRRNGEYLACVEAQHATAADGKPWSASPANNQVTTREGWRLQYSEWQPGSTPPRPKLIDAEHPGGGDVQQMALRIVIAE